MYLSSRIAPYGFAGPSGWSGGWGDVASVQGQVSAAANRYGVPEWLALAVAKTESSFNPAAVSPVGAIGVMQLMPGTAKDLGVDPRDTSQNIDGGVRLLSQLLKRYDGDASLALAAYNAGPGNVAKYGGVPPFPETQNYLTRILGGGWNVSGEVGTVVPPMAGDAADSGYSPGWSVDTELPGSADGLSPLAWGALALAAGALVYSAV